MSEKDSAAEKIKEMAKMSILSNRINEIQEKNLKLYPFVFFDGVKSVEIEYDLSHTKAMSAEEAPKDTAEEAKSLVAYLNKPLLANNTIAYHLTIDETEKNDSMDRRLLALEKAVRDLFWKNISVEVYFNDRIIFKSKK